MSKQTNIGIQFSPLIGDSLFLVRFNGGQETSQIYLEQVNYRPALIEKACRLRISVPGKRV